MSLLCRIDRPSFLGVGLRLATFAAVDAVVVVAAAAAAVVAAVVVAAVDADDAGAADAELGESWQELKIRGACGAQA